MVNKNSRAILSIIAAVLIVIFLAVILDSKGNVLSLGSQGIACGGEFNYRVQCPPGSYCREMPRASLSTPYMGGTCAPLSLQPLDKLEEVLLRVHR